MAAEKVTTPSLDLLNKTVLTELNAEVENSRHLLRRFAANAQTEGLGFTLDETFLNQMIFMAETLDRISIHLKVFEAQNVGGAFDELVALYVPWSKRAILQFDDGRTLPLFNRVCDQYYPEYKGHHPVDDVAEEVPAGLEHMSELGTALDTDIMDQQG
ncbi:hypothetical protein FKW77_000684 [Venturia effusa]|uniref:Uncharacterized protein n=1 Tax=Venturia effusa TaxID=50376 RepID=A0A517LHY7_9PEZI|nr:hypothetical protein FKW77_000684 [Venturia effusa]